MNAPITPELLLLHLRVARTRAKLVICEIDTIGLALKSNVIDLDDAIAWLDDVGALRFLLPPDSQDAGKASP